jgi:UDP-N-acetylglucosamine 4,6-dehydratase/5-epimerase
MLNNKSILVTGGTGSFGSAYVKSILKKFPKIKRLVIFSRDELKQYELQNVISPDKYKCLRFFLGDMRDEARLQLALKGIDIVIHTAALKQVPAAEYNPTEFIKTNIIGAQNLINCCLKENVKKVIALSTDKAAAPVNLYGATKLCADKLFIAANNIKGTQNILFSTVRYGNVMESRGSVIPLFKKLKDKNEFPITHPEMTRFNILMQESIELVNFAINYSCGGEIFVPKIPSYRILDVAKAINSNAKLKIVGVRPGEKIHEDLITSSESNTTINIGKFYVILPSTDHKFINKFKKKFNIKFVKKGFNYNSGTNEDFLSVTELKKLIFK